MFVPLAPIFECPRLYTRGNSPCCARAMPAALPRVPAFGKRQTNLCIEISPCVPFGHLVEMTEKRSFSYELLCNAMSDERGLPRVISCATRNVAAYAAINPWRCEQLFFTAYHAQHGFREASKTRRTPYSTPVHQPLEMRAVHEARAFTTGSVHRST